MSQKRVRLAPEEVKAALEAEKRAAEQPPAAPFHNPFAAARAELDKLAPKKPTAAQRLRARAARPTAEPTPLAQARARARAERQALSAAVAPIRRPSRDDEPQHD